MKKLSYHDKKKIVTERYKMHKDDSKLIEHVIGRGSFTIGQVIKQIEEDDDYGKELVEIEMQYISRILEKYQKG